MDHPCPRHKWFAKLWYPQFLGHPNLFTPCFEGWSRTFCLPNPPAFYWLTHGFLNAEILWISLTMEYLHFWWIKTMEFPHWISNVVFFIFTTCGETHMICGWSFSQQDLIMYWLYIWLYPQYSWYRENIHSDIATILMKSKHRWMLCWTKSRCTPTSYSLVVAFLKWWRIFSQAPLSMTFFSDEIFVSHPIS